MSDNPISELHELAQARGWSSPVYQFNRIGHQLWSGSVALDGKEVGTGGQGSKDETKHQLAQQMLQFLAVLDSQPSPNAATARQGQLWAVVEWTSHPPTSPPNSTPARKRRRTHAKDVSTMSFDC